MALKVGNDATSLLRPDKIILYFAAFDGVAAGPRRVSLPSWRVARAMVFRSRRSSPTAMGSLSCGMDPPRSEHMLEWQERESWRLWAHESPRPGAGCGAAGRRVLEPWQYALARIEFEGIDASTWTPHGDLWAEAA